MIKIDVSQIPKTDVRNLSSTLCGAVKRFYENPENLERFVAWKQEREKRKVQ